MSTEKPNEELINNIELEVKSDNNSNSEALSVDDLPKKEIISKNNNKSDPYTEIKLLTKKNSNNKIENKDKINTKEKRKEKSTTPIKLKDALGDLTPIIKEKIKAKVKENNKVKKTRGLSVSGISSTRYLERNNKILDSMQSSRLNTFSNTNYGNMDSNSKNKKNIKNLKNLKSKANISAPKKNTKNDKTKKIKKKAELFVNKKRNDKTDLMKMNGNLTSWKNEKKNIKFNDVLKRFEEEKKTAKKRFDNKKKELKDKEKLICTGKPKILKKKGMNNDKYSKDFLERQKELDDHLKLKKQRLKEEDNKKKEKEYQKIKNDSIFHKKTKKIRKSGSEDHWVERLYKEDTKQRKIKKECLEQATMPTFRPFLPKKKLNKSADKIGDVIEKYSARQNPQLLIDYISKNNKIDKTDNLFRQKIFNKFCNKNKKKSNSIEININNEDNNNNNNTDEDEDEDDE